MRELEQRLRLGGGAIARRDHRDIAGSLDRQLRAGALVAILPGVYCAADAAQQPSTRLRASCLWAGPDAVLTGLAAARATFWPDCRLDSITVALPTSSKESRGTFLVERRRIPPGLVRRSHQLAVTAPSLTAVDMAVLPTGGDVIDRVLRSRMASLGELWEVHRQMSQRAGNRMRAELLRDSRDEPWSEAERLQHRLLRAARITGWRTNVWVRAGQHGYFVDVLFARHRLVLEVDGFETHGTREAFEADRFRRNELVLAGFVVLNFTWRQLVDESDWVLGCIRQALRR
ncbi:MAG TPA: DUF559 domain-containing protein [Propionibacteriaceae bacterium]|nr:DUF559 domain-containing protein [Propionibacteriaceae bacterium]